MTKFVAIGALIEKNLGMSKFKEISEFKGVEYAFVETGRSNDLFQERQFGQFGEASIMTIIVQNKFKDEDIPYPDFWGGYLIKPTSIEFWQGRSSRMHDRILYQKKSGNWELCKLYP